MVTDFIRDFTGIPDEVTLRRSGGSFSALAAASIRGRAGAGTRGAQAGGQAFLNERGNGMAAILAEGSTEAGGGPVRHIPVLLKEVRAALEPFPARSSSMAPFMRVAYLRHSRRRCR